MSRGRKGGGDAVDAKPKVKRTKPEGATTKVKEAGKEQGGTPPTADEFPLRCSLYLLRDKKVAKMQMKSEKELRRMNEKMDLPGQRIWLRYEMRRIMRTSLLDDAAEDYPAHQAWRYCDLFKQLWDWLRKLVPDAKNPNVRNEAARVLGGLIHEIGTREGKRWIKSLSGSNDAFKDALYPFGEGGGKPPKEDLQRWVRGKMVSVEWHWLKATKVSRRVTTGRFRTLADAWTDYFDTRPSPRSSGEKELVDHPFAKLPFAVLSDFPKLWDAALERLFRAEWNREKKAKVLKVKGEQSFVKRFGDFKHKPEAGYYATQRHFERWWRLKLLSQIESEQAMQEYWKKRKEEIKEGHSLLGIEDADLDALVVDEFLKMV
jgi:hypothetical protein